MLPLFAVFVVCRGAERWERKSDHCIYIYVNCVHTKIEAHIYITSSQPPIQIHINKTSLYANKSMQPLSLCNKFTKGIFLDAPIQYKNRSRLLFSSTINLSWYSESNESDNSKLLWFCHVKIFATNMNHFFLSRSCSDGRYPPGIHFSRIQCLAIFKFSECILPSSSKTEVKERAHTHTCCGM